MNFDVIILGAGAAGLFCAAEAGALGLRAAVVDHAEAPGKKILISGGGRCNFTNLHTAPDRYLSVNPHFAKSALGRFTAADFIALVDAHGIAWHEKTLGQLFCDGSARQILAMLLNRCAEAKVEILCGAAVSAVGYNDGRFAVTTSKGSLGAPALVVATGGPSIPKLGASVMAYDLARQFRLKVVEPRPALVPLTLPGEDLLFRELSGVSAEVLVRTDGPWGRTAFHEAALFTHRGLSGPAILQISSYWRRGQALYVDFFPGRDGEWLIAAKQANARASFGAALRTSLPERLADALAARLEVSGPLGGLSDGALRKAAARLAQWPFIPNGSEGFAKAEVTAGGVSTAELSSKTMEAKRVPGLYFIGEAVDVTGWLGGYNFQWAWASAWAAAQALGSTWKQA